jgi:hypothetical protein
VPRMKWGADFDELPDDWEESDFEPYDGPEPPSNKLLNGEVKKMWAATFSSGNEGIVALFEAGGNTGDREKYNGWSTFERIPLIPSMNWKYGPLLEALGITLEDVKRRTVVEDEDDNVGTPIKKIGKLTFPKACAVITKREKNGDEVEARAGKFAAVSKKSKSAKATSAKARSRRAADEDDDEYDDDPPF